MSIRVYKILYAILFVALFHSCSITKHIKDGTYLVTKNTIDITYPDSLPSKYYVNKNSALEYIPLSQTPNARFFGIDVRTWLYFQSKPDKDNWWNRTLRKLGDEPVIYSLEESDKSVNNMSIFMDSEGYLDNKISLDASFSKKRAKINYRIEANQPYLVDTVFYNFEDISLAKRIGDEASKSLIRSGELLRRSSIEQERKRIETSLNNDGYYTFRQNNINFLIDTFKSVHLANVQVNVTQDEIAGKSVPHRIYHIRKINVYPNFGSEASKSTVFDTVKVQNINFLYPHGKHKISAKFIERQLMFGVDSTWSPYYQDLSIRNLLNMKYYRTASIDFTNLSARDTTSKYGALEANVKLTPAKLNGFMADAEISSNSNYSSILARIGYSNRNLFRHSEYFDVTLNAGYDLFYSKLSNDAYQVGVQTSLSFPKLIVPFRVNKSRYINNIESKISLGYDLQNRPDYQRHLFSSTFGYSWSNGKRLNFNYKPISVNYIKLPWVNEEFLNTLTNPYLKNSYTNQLIAGTTFGVVYNDNHQYGSSHTIKINAETAGNTIYAGSNLFGAHQYVSDLGENYYTLLDMRYAQYARADIDYSYKYNFTPKYSLVTRIYVGGGLGYGNSSTIPFERLFYAGGNASMRGWQIRGVGLGEQPLPESDSGYPNQLGDIRLELNLEGRFPIWGPVRGALFFDTGNVWSNGKGETDERAIFHIDTFYKQLAFNTGIGLRFDLSFFVLRLDWGIILHNPSLEQGQRWIQDFNLKNTALHFAIGYPF